MSETPAAIGPAELALLLAGGREVVVLDVREAWEVALAPFPGAVHLPMDRVPQEVGRALDPDRPVVVVCHRGVRSHAVGCFLLARDHAEVYNLAGGIDAWSREVDPTVPRY